MSANISAPAYAPWLRVADRVDELRVYPKVAIEVTQVLQRPSWSMRKLVKTLEGDPVLCGRLLRIANSPLYGRKRPVQQLKEACMVLGALQVRDLALALALAGLGSSSPHHARLWTIALRTGLTAEAIGRWVPTARKGQTFTAGLLANIGQLALLAVEPDRYGGLLDLAAKKRMDLPRAEQAMFGFSHPRLSGEILRRWNLPPNTVSVVETYHLDRALQLPPSAHGTRQAVRTANRIVDVLDQEPDIETVEAYVAQQDGDRVFRTDAARRRFAQLLVQSVEPVVQALS